MSKYLFALLFTILVKNTINSLCWSKLCPKLNFRQNLYKADISIKRKIFFCTDGVRFRGIPLYLQKLRKKRIRRAVRKDLKSMVLKSISALYSKRESIRCTQRSIKILLFGISFIFVVWDGYFILLG